MLLRYLLRGGLGRGFGESWSGGVWGLGVNGFGFFEGFCF